jgi:hypothetical protein
LDSVFKNHDRAYQEAEDAYKTSNKSNTDRIDYWNRIIKADKEMLKGIQDLRKNGELGKPVGIAPESSDYGAGRDATIIFRWKVLPERELSRDRLADPRRLYEEGKWRAPDAHQPSDSGDPFTGMPWPDNSVVISIRNKTQTASTIPSPIALDLDGDGIETVSVANGTFFDHAADGFAELTGWVGPDDGFLVRDVNANGTIDSGRELFGSETLLANGLKAANGFEALKGLDTNADGVIDANDTAFAELRVWKDADGNGRTDAGELFSLAEAGVHSINVHYTNSNFIDPQGNAHRQVGSYTTTSGQPRAATDLWVKTDATHSVPTQWVDVPDDIAALPNAQGYGKVRDLHQAMAMDATGELKALVLAFTQASTPKDRDALATQIIYRWTGVQDVDPTSRASRFAYGNAIGDARKLEALEEFMGEEWVGVWCWGERDPNPHGRAAPVLLAAWGELKALVYGQLMAQSQLNELFLQIDYCWDEELGGVTGCRNRRTRHPALRRTAPAHRHRPRAAQAPQGIDLRRSDFQSGSANRRAIRSDHQPTKRQGHDDFYYTPSTQRAIGG